MMPMETGGSWWGALAQVLLLALLQLPSASAPLGSFCATEERGCFRDCYDPAKKQCALHVVVWLIHHHAFSLLVLILAMVCR